MPIISSEVIVDSHAQRGGARYVREIHTDQDGRKYEVGPYLVQPGFDVDARANSRVLELNEQLAVAEMEEILRGA